MFSAALYRPGGKRVLRVDPGLSDALTAPTAHGFVAVLRSPPLAYVGLRQVRLRELGLGRVDVLAVDATGTRIALAGGRHLAVTDEGVEEVVLRADRALPDSHGDVRDMVFLSPTEVVSAASTGGLYRFELDCGALFPTAWSGTAPHLFRVFAVPAWRTVGGVACSGPAPHRLTADRTTREMDEAIDLYVQNIFFATETLGADDALALGNWHDIGHLYFHSRRASKAVEVSRRALPRGRRHTGATQGTVVQLVLREIQERAFGPDSGPALESLLTLVSGYDQAGRLDEARGDSADPGGR
ncbi:hypothetical protein [Streptomyces sp. NPDC003247]|uniref:hypothetical protein n=1 Tax=Streptomyces sp. NPDC003247 TaxID=3364677 RepID=UPI0036B3FA9C